MNTPVSQGARDMKPRTMLTITSLLTILFLIFHMTDDILREGGMAVGGTRNLTVVVVLAIFLYGTLVLAGRRSGQIITLIAGLAGLGMPVLHMALARTVIANDLARARGDYLFVWTLLAVGVTGLFTLVLSARSLWNPQWGQSRSPGAGEPERRPA
ncbi:MAG TPA: hypothetical protein VLD58_08290 [Gemmatimonadales bacterium]|nr:hypothetical protein [Gemmatimonadales bacterium]